MSSILKALKRIEESTPPAEAADSAPALGPRGFRNNRQRKSRRTVLIIAGALAVAAAAASGVFIFGRDRLGTPALPTAETRQPPGAIRAKVAAPPGPSTQAPGAVAGAVGPAAGESGAVSPSPLPRRPPAQALPPRPAPRTTRETPRPPTADPAPPTARAPAAPRSAEDRLGKLDGSKLKLMAIAWYAEAERRIAVINGSIVREGESVEGYRILQIRKDDVVVSDGSGSWRVEFGLRTQP